MHERDQGKNDNGEGGEGLHLKSSVNGKNQLRYLDTHKMVDAESDVQTLYRASVFTMKVPSPGNLFVRIARAASQTV